MNRVHPTAKGRRSPAVQASTGKATGKNAGTQPKQPRARGSNVQAIYDSLRHDIIEMKIQPGEALDETRLSQRFHMSRTPVREALVRLSAEGLVTALTNRNTIVTPIDFSNVPAYFDALMLMYRVTTRLAAERRTEADLVEIRALQVAFTRSVEAADAFAMIVVNRDFHLAIAEAGGNRYYTDFFRRLLDEGRRLLRLYYSSYGDHLPVRYVEEHNEIIQSIVDRDLERADRLATDHAGQVISQIQRFLASGVGADIVLSAERSGRG